MSPMRETLMRYGLAVLVLLLGACSQGDMTRGFSLSRDSAPETVASTQMPLSMPPDMATRPKRPGALTPQANASQVSAPPADVSTGSAGQDAFLDAAGGAPSSSDVRTQIDESSGLVYPNGEFVSRVMNWTPPPGYHPMATQPSKGWFSGLFNWF
jgi:hypothetical protein